MNTRYTRGLTPGELLMLAPCWNVGSPTMHFTAWSDEIESSLLEPQNAGEVLRGFAYALTGIRAVRPSITRFLNSATPAQLIPWILRANEAGCDRNTTVDWLNRVYR